MLSEDRDIQINAGLAQMIHAVEPISRVPHIKIRTDSSWHLIDFRDLWAHRELFYFLVWRDLKVRYKQTVLGALWVILQPLLMTLIFVVFLGFVVRVPSENIPYPLFLYSALLAWTFFSNAVASSSFSLVGNASMITKVYFPRVIVPLASVTVRLADFLIASVILFALIAYYRISPGWNLLLAPLLVAHLTILATGIGLFLAALNVKYRDVGTVLPVLLQLWMFISPVIYPTSLIPARWQPLYNLNPLTGIIENFRASLFGLPLNYKSLLSSVIVTVIILLYSTYVFRQLEDEFADVI
jgi:homopolymeric O-antigen transport system permease protein